MIQNLQSYLQQSKQSLNTFRMCTLSRALLPYSEPADVGITYYAIPHKRSVTEPRQKQDVTIRFENGCRVKVAGRFQEPVCSSLVLTLRCPRCFQRLSGVPQPHLQNNALWLGVLCRGYPYQSHGCGTFLEN